METFLKYVLERSEEIGIHQENRGDSETFLSELVVHVDLLGKTAIFAWNFEYIVSWPSGCEEMERVGESLFWSWKRVY